MGSIKRLSRRALSLLAALGLLAALALPAGASPAETGETVVISSAEDLEAFAKNCSLDAWSRGKTVRLAADIDLEGREFAPIPIFCGAFDGQGRTISGLRITAAGSDMGLFRYVEPEATIKNLHLSGLVVPEGSRKNVGGIAGVNNGSIEGCSFRGSVQGKESVGGITGKNGETGRVVSCASAGQICGELATGGVAGRNFGLLLKCENSAGVNLAAARDSLSLEDLDVQGAFEDRIISAGGEGEEELLPSCSDTGGVTGWSGGVVQSCVNTGSVGYPHVGYNTGGIAGRQSGYLAGCVNSGVIHGRKDVGGIAGQSEPLLALSADEDALERIRRELDALDALINRALNDAQNAGDGISARLTAMGEYTDSAKDRSRELLDQSSDFLDGNIETINTLSADIANALDSIVPALDNLADTGGRLERLSRSLGDAMSALDQAADMGGEAMEGICGAVDILRQSGGSLSEAAGALRSALEALLGDIASGSGQGGEEQESASLAQVKEALGDLDGAFSQAAEGVSQLQLSLAEADPLPQAAEALPALGDLSSALADLAGGLDQAAGALPPSPGDWESAKENLRKAGQALADAAEGLNGALTKLQEALAGASPLPGKLSQAMGRLEDASLSAAAIGRLLGDAFRTISGAVEDLTEDGPAAFTPLGEGFRVSSSGLYDALSGLTGEMDGLNSLLQDSGDNITADLRAVSRQFNAVFDSVLDALSDLRDGRTDREILQDASERDAETSREGKITNCRNTGPVEGDRNVGGAVGAMSIELSSAPEDNGSSRFSLGAAYETTAVLEGCVNRGAVTAKKDCAGGLVGRMDLGVTLNCQNYGAVESNGGDYVGGVAGLADAAVEGCFSKSALAGRNYVGGAAGWASRLRNCYAITTITRGEESLGALAGGVEEGGVLSGNRFVDTGAAGVDGVSYAGRAEPIPFAELMALPNIPAEFTAFTLTLTADGEIVSQIPFYYGDDLSQLTLPPVPDREDCYGVWPEFDVSGAKSDLTVEAVYTPWITLVPSLETEGRLALALAEGRFTQEAVLRVTDSTQAPPPEAAEEAVVRRVSLTGADLAPGAETPLRLLAPGGGDAAVWRLTPSGWESVDAQRSGSYLLLSMTGAEEDFCLQPQSQNLTRLLPVGAAALLLLLAAGKAVKKRRSGKSPKSNPPKEGGSAPEEQTAAGSQQT